MSLTATESTWSAPAGPDGGAGRVGAFAPVGSSRTLGRAGSVLAASSVLVHAAMAATGGHSMAMVFTHVVMVLACVPCMVCLWSGPSISAWVWVLVVGVAMVLTHVWMVSSMAHAPSGAAGGGALGGGHGGGGVAGASMEVLPSVAMAVAVVEVSVAVWVVTVEALESVEV